MNATIQSMILYNQRMFDEILGTTANDNREPANDE